MENNAVSKHESDQVIGVNQSEKNLAMIVYVLQAASLFVGVTALVGVIINHVKSSSLTDPVVKSHNSWQIRTFWWMLLWSVICLGITAVTLGIGGFLLLIPAVWYIYRFVKGIMRLNDGQMI
jgi:uncharacterized membrane protein